MWVTLFKDPYTEERLSKLGLNERQLKAVKYVQGQDGNGEKMQDGQISNQIYQDLTKTTKRTASRDLTDLVSHGAFQKSGVTGKGTLYELKNFSDGGGFRGGSGYGGGSASGSGFGDGTGQGDTKGT